MNGVPIEFIQELQEAIDIGITEGFNLSAEVPVWAAAVMALRACKYAVAFNGGCWDCRVKE